MSRSANDVNVVVNVIRYVSISIQYLRVSNDCFPGPCILSKARQLCNFSWETYNEDISSLGESPRITVPGLLEHLNVTSYLWYTTR